MTISSLNATNCLVRTLSFYDAVGKIPLTIFELHKYAIKTGDGAPMPIKDIIQILDEARNDPNSPISVKNGYYFLKNNVNAYEKQLETGKASIKKWSRALKCARIISLLPYVRMIFITGSLAHGSANPSSDIDVLICSKSKRIWTVRLVVSAVMHALGKRRHGGVIKDRICLNHFISEENPRLRPNNLFSAHIARSSVLVWGNRAQENSFCQRNYPLLKNSFLNRRMKMFIDIRRINKRPRALYAMLSAIEYILEKTYAGNAMESLLRKIQIGKIKKTLTKKAIDERQVIFDDLALVFNHPRPEGQEALLIYKDNLKMFCY